MAKKKPFKRRYNFDTFAVVVTNHSLAYLFVDEESGEEMEHYVPSMFFNNVAGKEDFELQIVWKDSWGSEMTLTNYQPTSLESMFEFLGRAYRIPFFNFGILSNPIHIPSEEAVEQSIKEELDKEEVTEDAPAENEELEDGQIMTGFHEGFPSRVDIRVDAMCGGLYCPVCGEANNLANMGTDISEALGLKCPKCKVQLVLHTVEPPKNEATEGD